MNNDKPYFQLKGKNLHRQRLDDLLELGLSHSLVTVFAGPGYGKTYAVTSFLKKYPCKLVWQHATVLDNNVSHFARSLIRAIQVELPQLSETLIKMEIQKTDSASEVILKEHAREACANGKVCYVIDNYNVIAENEQIRGFIEFLISAKIDNFCIIIISNKRTDIELAAMQSLNGVFRISSDDLKFTQDEVSSLLTLYDIVEEDVSQALYSTTDGWALAIELIAPWLSNSDDLRSIINQAEKSLPQIPLLFERFYYSQYSYETKKLMVKLSLLPEFDIDTAREISDIFTGEMLEAISSNVFISYNPGARTYTMQSMYQEFLREKRVVLSDQEILDVYSCAAAHFLKIGRMFEAIELFYDCGKYDDVLKAFMSQKVTRMSASYADFMITYLEKLPEEFLYNNPESRYLIATAYLNNHNIEKAHRILLILEDQLSDMQDDNSKAILGEVYLSLAGILMLEANVEFCEYYRKSAELLPGGSTFQEKNFPIVGTTSPIFMPTNEPGELDRVMNIYETVVPYMQKVLNGTSIGLDILVKSEAAYYRYQLAASKEKAYSAVYTASKSNQHDIVLYAYWNLCKIALVQGNTSELTNLLKTVSHYVNHASTTVTQEFKEVIYHWYYLKMGDFEKFSHQTKDGIIVQRENPPIYSGGDQLIYAEYLLEKHRYYELLALLEGLYTLYSSRSVWIGELKVIILRSICYLKLGEIKPSMDYLHEAYEMSYANDVITPFIEMGSHMRALIDRGKKAEFHTLDKDWMDGISQKASTYAKKIAAIKTEYAKRNNLASSETIRLSKREQEVLEALAQGMTREEIASNFNLSVNTIKSNIKQIYNKLGAVNRADAIRLAASMGLID